MQYKFTATCSKDRLKDIRQFVSRILDHYSLSEVKKNELVLAVDEVCANLIIHSHNCNQKEYFDLVIKIKKNDGITFDIIDKGIGFNIQKYKEPKLTEIIKRKRKGGMGLMLVRRIMDKIEFTNEPTGNVCRLYKKIHLSR